MAYEADLEAWCRERAVRAGGSLLKWVSPGNKGVPDRILLMPRCVSFLEFKSPTGQLDPLQRVWQNRILGLDLNADVVRDRASFTRILNAAG